MISSERTKRTLPQISVAAMLDLVDLDHRERVIEMLAKASAPAGFVVYCNQQFDSSRLGSRSFLVFGAPYSMGSVEEVIERHKFLHDLPSQREYPVSFCMKGDAGLSPGWLDGSAPT